MRLNEEMFNKVQSGKLVGLNAPNGRVTVEPYWTLRKTNASYGNSIRGPYRYYTDGSPIEYEVPSIKSISWNRSQGQDLATCEIQIYNAWHEGNEDTPELAAQLGKPGYFWPKRGVSDDSQATWNQSPGRGAYKKDGTWDSNFSWEDVLVEDVIIRTFEGYGGRPTDGNYVSIQDNLDNGDLLQTGVWIVDTVTGGSDGILTLSCRDIGRILLDQMIFPPLVPPGLYPLEYYTEGKSPFDSFWGPKVKTGVSPASQGEVKVYGTTSSGDGDASRSSHPVSHATDGDVNTYALSEAYENPDPNTVWFDFDCKTQDLNKISFKPWAGGYECYVSVKVGGVCQGSSTVPGGSQKYVKMVNIAHSIPNNRELYVNIELKNVSDLASASAHYNDVQNIRLTFKHLYYATTGNGSGHHYRAGIRDFVAYRAGANVSPYDPNFATQPWTYSMEQHPTRGYWVVDDSGNVYGFGDAADFDSTGFGRVLLDSFTNNKSISMAGTPSGKGYWVLDWQGRVWAYGDAVHYGDVIIGDPWTPFLEHEKPRAVSIARTYTGKGYWVAYSHGVVHGFGDATPSYSLIPTTNVSWYMEQFLRKYYRKGFYKPYLDVLKCTAISAHPNKMGFLATDGSGQVWAYGDEINRGMLQQRVYNNGMADSFRLMPLEYATSLEHTATGNGYWITFGSGRIASFGDAVNQGPVDIYQGMRDLDYNIVREPLEIDTSFFRALIYGLARDPDGSGFWALAASGNIYHYNAEFWGSPGYQGLTGYRWHAGNFDGNWTSIVKDVLMWAGFLNYDSGIGGGEAPSVLGNMESTGIKTDTNVSGDRFDKKTVIDVVKELAEVVGYLVYVDEEGRIHFESSSWWAAGNADLNGEKIFVAEEGSFTQVAEGTPGAVPFIPIIHESADMLSYSATLSSADKRSELIIGTDLPDPQDPSRTGFVRYIPPTANETIQNSSISAMRGIVRQGLWSSNLFENSEERQLMAELIGLHAWFGKRTGSVSTVANYSLGLNDQIRLVERNTSESFIHLITAISSELDLDSGSACVDEETEILTQRGWLAYDEVEAGDMSLAINPETGLSSWEEINFVYISDNQDHSMIDIDMRSHKSLSTPNHRWLTWSASGQYNNRKHGWKWKTSETLKSCDEIPKAVEHADYPLEETYSDEFVELVAWFWTEGNASEGCTWSLAQSHRANPEHVQRITKMLERGYGPPGNMMGNVTPGAIVVDKLRDVELYDKPSGCKGFPDDELCDRASVARGFCDMHYRRWRKTVTTLDVPPRYDANNTVLGWANKLDVCWHTASKYIKDKDITIGGEHLWNINQRIELGMTDFRLSKMIRHELMSVVDTPILEDSNRSDSHHNKIVSLDFIKSLTKEQLLLFIDVSMLGDGCYSDKDSLSQGGPGARERIEPFEFALALAGVPFSERIERIDSQDRIVVTLLKTDKVNPVAANMRTDNSLIRQVDYSGRVWCPNLKHHNWLARRRGTVFFTGNTMNLTTHWLGDADNWVLTTDNVTPGSPYVRISERVDSWQSNTNRGLGSGTATPDGDKLVVTGEFDALTATLEESPRWGIESLSYLDTGTGDDTELLSMMMYGNGVKWPFEQATPSDETDSGETFTNSYLQAYASSKEPVLTFAYCPEELQDAGDEGPDQSDLTPYVDALIDQLGEFVFNKVIVWKDMTVFGYDNARYMTFYNAVYDAIKAFDDDINVFGPNVKLAARSAGYDTSYNGVSIDSRDIGTLNYFIANANGYDGLAVSGDFSDADWADVVDYIKASISTDPLIISMRTASAASPTSLNDALDVTDIAFWPSTTPFTTPVGESYSGWTFEGTLTTKTSIANLYVDPEIMSAPLGSSIFIKVYDGATLLVNKELTAENNPVLLGNFGSLGTTKEYTFTVTGATGTVGTGTLRLNFYASSIDDIYIQDQLLVIGG